MSDYNKIASMPERRSRWSRVRRWADRHANGIALSAFIFALVWGCAWLYILGKELRCEHAYTIDRLQDEGCR